MLMRWLLKSSYVWGLVASGGSCVNGGWELSVLPLNLLGGERVWRLS